MEPSIIHHSIAEIGGRFIVYAHSFPSGNLSEKSFATYKEAESYYDEQVDLEMKRREKRR